MDIKIGIVGSSNSKGNNHQGTDQVSDDMADVCKYHMPDYEFINCAYQGFGSERFLQYTVYLKETYNITHLLIENVENRTHKSFHDGSYWFEKMEREVDKDPSKIKNYYPRFMKHKNVYYTPWLNEKRWKNTVLGDVPLKKAQTWCDVNLMLVRSKQFYMQGLLDVHATKILCKHLQIRPMTWVYDPRPGRVGDHPKISSALSYFRDIKGNKKREHIGPDQGHLTNEAQYEIVEQYIKPIIEKTIHDKSF
jgi:hypothetical protein